MEQVKPVVTEKHEFENEVESTLNAIFGIFGLSESLSKEKTPQIFNHLVCQNFEVSHRGLD